MSNSLVTPWTLAHQIPLSMGFPREEYWSGLPFPPPRGLFNPGVEPTSLASPVLAGRFVATSATIKANVNSWRIYHACAHVRHMGAEGHDTRAWSGGAQHHLGRQAGELIITINVLRIRAQVYMGNGASMGKKWFSVDGSCQTVSPMSVFLKLDAFVWWQDDSQDFPRKHTIYKAPRLKEAEGVWEAVWHLTSLHEWIVPERMDISPHMAPQPHPLRILLWKIETGCVAMLTLWKHHNQM